MEISRNSIFSNISWSFAEKLLTDVINLLISVVLARLLYPEDYGLVALVQIFITISSIFVTCGMGTALIQNKEASDVQISTIFYLNVFVGLALYIILFFMAPIIAKFRGNQELTAIIRVLSIKVPLSSVYSIQHSYIQKRMEFKKFFLSSLVGTLASGAVGIIMAYSGYGVWSLVFATLIDQILDSLILFITTKWIPKFKFNLKESERTIIFGFKLLVLELIGRLYEQSRSLVIGLKYNSADLAYNSKGAKFPQQINDLTNSVAIKVLFPVLSNIQDDKEKMIATVRESVIASTYVLSPLLMGFAAVSNKIIPLLLTDKWIGAIPYIQIYCFIYLTSPVSALDNRIIQACGRSDYLFKYNIITISFNIALLFVVVLCFDKPIAIAESLLVCSVFSSYILSKSVEKITGYTVKEHIKDVLPNYILVFSMMIVVYYIGLIKINNILLLVFQILSGACYYLVLSYLFNMEGIKYYIQLIKNRKDE